MESKHFLLVALYLVPFAIPLFMPGWRSLSVIASLTGLYLIWFFVVHTLSTGLAGAAEAVLFLLVAMALGMGILTRVTTLVMRHFSWPFWARFSAIFIGALAPMAIMLMPAAS